MSKKDSSKKVKYFNAVLQKCHEIQHELLQINKKIAWDEEIDEHTNKIHNITTELISSVHCCPLSQLTLLLHPSESPYPLE